MDTAWRYKLTGCAGICADGVLVYQAGSVLDGTEVLISLMNRKLGQILTV